MLILTPENVPFDVDQIVDTTPEEMYCTLDLTDIDDSDYYFHHILHVYSFVSISAELEIGGYRIKVPINWQLLLGDEDTGYMEVCTIENLLNMRNPCAFVYNPIRSMYAEYLPVKVINLFTLPTRWQIPSLRKRNLLVVPLANKENPKCVLFADENEKIQEFTVMM